VEIIKQFVDLYINVFEKYPLAAAITTLLFVILYFVWMRFYNEQQPETAWKWPAIVCFVGWLILTPLLGLIVSALTVLKDVLTSIAGLYIYVFKTFPEASGIVTVVFLGLYFIWILIIKKWRQGKGIVWPLSHPGIVLIVAWLVVTPILGLMLRWFEPHP